MPAKGSNVDTGVLVAVVALASGLATKLVDWMRARGKDSAEVEHIRATTERTHVESSNDIVANFEKLLDEKTRFFEIRITAVKGELETRIKQLERRLDDAQDARIAAEARADAAEAELATARRMHAESEQYIEVLASTLQHHSLEIPIRPTHTGDNQ